MIRDQKKLTALLREVHDWVRAVAQPNEKRVAKETAIPADIMADMAERGFFGWSIPEEYGGAGLTAQELTMATMEISQCGLAFRACIGANTGVGSQAIVDDGTEEQKRRFLPRLASGEKTGSVAIAEPNAGSMPSSINTTAIRDGDDYILNGIKCNISNAPNAELFTVLARSDPNSTGSQGISSFIVERETPGLSTSLAKHFDDPIKPPLGEIYLKNCRVPAENLIGGVEGTAYKTAMKTRNKQQIQTAAHCTGPAIRMLDLAYDHAMDRPLRGNGTADFIGIGAMVTDCQTEIQATRALILQTAHAYDLGENIRVGTVVCKDRAINMYGQVADRCVQIFGGANEVPGDFFTTRPACDYRACVNGRI